MISGELTVKNARAVGTPARTGGVDSTVVTTMARSLMHDWLFTQTGEEYAISSDWDDRWRTGGRLEDVIDEAHLSPVWVLKGIQRFVSDRDQRLAGLRESLAEALE